MIIQSASKKSTELTWIKSSYSTTDGPACVEVASRKDGIIHVRDSKDPDGPWLSFPSTEWQAFVALATGLG